MHRLNPTLERIKQKTAHSYSSLFEVYSLGSESAEHHTASFAACREQAGLNEMARSGRRHRASRNHSLDRARKSRYLPLRWPPFALFAPEFQAIEPAEVRDVIGGLLVHPIACRQFCQAHFTGEHGALVIAFAIEYRRPGRGKIVTLSIHDHFSSSLRRKVVLL